MTRRKPKIPTKNLTLRLPLQLLPAIKAVQARHEVDGLSDNTMLVTLIKRGLAASPELRPGELEHLTESDINEEE